MRELKRLFQFLAIPVAVTGFVLVASQAGGFMLRKDPGAKVEGFVRSSGPTTRG